MRRTDKVILALAVLLVLAVFRLYTDIEHLENRVTQLEELVEYYNIGYMAIYDKYVSAIESVNRHVKNLQAVFDQNYNITRMAMGSVKYNSYFYKTSWLAANAN
jgi:regulator of sigma D